MDVAAQMAIEGLVAGLGEAKVVSYEQMRTILASIENSAVLADRSMPRIADDIRILVDNLCHITGVPFPRR